MSTTVAGPLAQRQVRGRGRETGRHQLRLGGHLPHRHQAGRRLHDRQPGHAGRGRALRPGPGRRRRHLPRRRTSRTAPPTSDHPYGHGKIENFSALIETLLLVITCVWIVYESIQRLFVQHVQVDAKRLGLRRHGPLHRHQHQSAPRCCLRPPESTTARHWRLTPSTSQTDVWSSWVVLGGLALVWLGQNVVPAHVELFTKADSVAALGVAVIVAFVTYDLGKRTVDVLLDSAPSGIPDARSPQAAAAVDGVIEVGVVRVRRSGPRLFVDMTVDVDRNLSFERTHAVAEQVEGRVAAGGAGRRRGGAHRPARERARERRRARPRHRRPPPGRGAQHQRPRRRTAVPRRPPPGGGRPPVAAPGPRHQPATSRGTCGPRTRDIVRVNTHIESRGTGAGNGHEMTADEPAMVRRIQEVTDGIAGAGAATP